MFSLCMPTLKPYSGIKAGLIWFNHIYLVGAKICLRWRSWSRGNRGRRKGSLDRKSTRLNSSHSGESRMPSSA